ncbi:MAG: HupE/UreJ family protein [Methylococcaceae bacterium]|nr:MAG: HupE/UreJ family protein [Methylococcaceae bacterium]
MRKFSCFMAVLAALAAPAALAHSGAQSAAGIVAGFIHPFTGLDHLAAMVAVGLWAALAAPQRVWSLPVAFVLVMALGAALGVAGVSPPDMEIGIAASVLLLGGLLAAMARLPLSSAVALVGLFALLHGFAHGREMAADADFAVYAAGFVAATGMLHLFGIGLGRLLLRAPVLYRGAGGLIGAWGVYLLMAPG